MFWAHWGKCISPLALACLSPYRSLLVTERSGLSLDCPPQPKLRTGAASGRMDGKIFYVYTASMKAKGELDLNQHYSSSSAKQPSVDAPGSLWILVHTFPSPCDVFLEKQEHRTWLFWLFDRNPGEHQRTRPSTGALQRSHSRKQWTYKNVMPNKRVRSLLYCIQLHFRVTAFTKDSQSQKRKTVERKQRNEM